MRKHILIVDDDLSFIIIEMLESYGYEAGHAETRRRNQTVDFVCGMIKK